MMQLGIADILAMLTVAATFGAAGLQLRQVSMKVDKLEKTVKNGISAKVAQIDKNLTALTQAHNDARKDCPVVPAAGD